MGKKKLAELPKYNAVERRINVDGDSYDWHGINANIVQGYEHLWFGQDMTPEKCRGNDDHSFTWRAAWFANKLYFLIGVTDDSLQQMLWTGKQVDFWITMDNYGEIKLTR